MLLWELRVTGARRRAYKVPGITPWETIAPQGTPTLSRCHQLSWSVGRRPVTTRLSGNSSSATSLSYDGGLLDAFRGGLAILWTQTT